MRTPTMLIAAVLAASSLGVASAASALVPADVTLTAGPVSTVVSVSPDIFYDAASSTYYLYTTGMRIGVYSSKDGTTWAEVPGASTPVGPYFDPSIVAMSDGSYRMYYAKFHNYSANSYYIAIRNIKCFLGVSKRCQRTTIFFSFRFVFIR